MTNQNELETKTNQNNQYHSDGSELIPAEVPARGRREGGEPPNEPAAVENTKQSDTKLNSAGGYTTDQEGLVNNYPVTPPTYYQEEHRVGFTQFAEKLNGRAAMLGFVALIITEIATGQGLLSNLIQ